MKTKGILMTVLGGLGKGLEQQGLQMREDRLNALKSAQAGMAELGRQEAVAKENIAQRAFSAEQGEVKFGRDKEILGIQQEYSTETAKAKMAFESGENALNRANQRITQGMADATRLTSERERGANEWKIAKLREENQYNIEGIKSATELESIQRKIDANTGDLEKKLSAKHDEMVAKTNGALALLDLKGEIDLSKIDLAKTWDADMLGTKLVAEQNIANDTQVSMDVRHQAGIDARLAEKELQAAVALRGFANARGIAVEKNATSKEISRLHDEAKRYATDDATRRTLDAIAAKGVTEANILELKGKLGIGQTSDMKGQSGILAAGKIEIGRERNQITEAARADAMTRFVETVKFKTEKNASLEDIARLRDDAKRYVADENTRRVLDAIAAKGVTDANLLELKSRLDMERTASGVEIGRERNRITEAARVDAMNRFLETVKLKTEQDVMRRTAVAALQDVKSTANKTLEATKAFGQIQKAVVDQAGRAAMKAAETGVEYANAYREAYVAGMSNAYPDLFKVKTVTTRLPYDPGFWETIFGDMPPQELDTKHFLEPTGKESPLAEKSQVRPTSGGMVKIQAVDGKWYIGPAEAVSSDGSVKVDKFTPTDPPPGYE